jgi:hypothetical protein
MIDHPHGYFADPETREPLPRGIPVANGYWADDGTRDFILTYPILYIDPKDAPCYVPVGARSNGLSNYFRLLWPICWPFEPLTRNAAFVHDQQCEDGVRWSLGAWRFYHAMIAMFIRAQKDSKWNRFRAGVRWAAVVFFGGPCHWVAVQFCKCWRHGNG